MLANAIKKRLNKEEGQKGFTLIELLAVIVIIGIIAVIAIPMISNILNKSRADADVASARQVYDAARIYITADLNGDFNNDSTKTNKTILITDLKSKGYLEPHIYLPSSKAEITSGSVVFVDGKLSSVSLNSESFSAEAVLKAAPVPTTASDGEKSGS